MLHRQQRVVTVHRIGRSDKDRIHLRRGAQLLRRRKAARNVVLRAVLLRSVLIAPPHPHQLRLLRSRKRRKKPPNRVVAEAKNRKAHRRSHALISSKPVRDTVLGAAVAYNSAVSRGGGNSAVYCSKSSVLRS